MDPHPRICPRRRFRTNGSRRCSVATSAGHVSPRVDTYEASLQRSPFGASNVTFAPGRPDIVRTIDEVVSNYLSMSFAAPDRFGERLEAFVAELTAMLSDVSPSGLFHDWPGDTAVVWATKST